MKQLFFLIAAIVLGFVTASAQIFEVLSMQKLDINLDTDVKVVAMSPKGDYILVTSGSNKGLWRYAFSTNQTTIITNAEGAGYNVQVGDDGQEIVYRETKIENNLRTNTIVRMNLNNTKRSVIAYSQRDLQKMVLSNFTTSVTIKDKKILLTQNGEEIILTPNGDEHSYIWPSISPDGTKLCYYVSGVGCYVSNIDGSNPQYIACDCRAAKWYNNTTLVAMADEDDGYFITASSIVVYTLDGNFQELTSKEMLAMYPQVSSGKITFSTVKGETYLLNVR